MNPFHRPHWAILLTLVWAITGLSACSKAPDVKVATVSRTSVEATVSTTSSGTVTAEQQAVLGFSAQGRIASVAVKLGDRVQAGQILAQLENADLKAILRDSETDLRRVEKLFQAGLVSRKAMDDARKNFTVAQSNLDKAVIRAPFTGMVTEVHLEVGESSQLQSTTVPIRLIDLKPRLVKGEIDEIDLPKVKTGALARVKIMALSSRSIPATVTRVVPFISTTKEQDRTSQIELKLSDSPELPPVGASADIEVVIASKESSLAIPTRAVLGTGQHRYVFRLEDGRIQKRPVEIGIGNYEKTEVVSGLEAGQKVVVPSDDLALRDGMKVGTETVVWP